MSQQLVNPSEYDGVIETVGEFRFFYPNKPIQCRAMVTCKNKVACLNAYRRKGVSLPTTPSNGEELTLEEEYSPSNEVFVADLPLVGSGTAKPLCGNFYKVGCLERHEPKELPKGIIHQRGLDGNCLRDGAEIHVHRFFCHRPLCPICTEEWQARATKRCLERFKVYDEDESNLRAGHQIHFIVSIPKRIRHKSYLELKRLAISEAKKVGFEGGSVIYHSKRKNAIKGMYFSPHFHMLGYGWIEGEQVIERHDKTGLIFKNAGLRKSLEGTIRYELNHAAVPQKSGHVVTWFGSMGYRNLHVEKVKGEKEKCLWGHPMHDVAYVGKEPLELPKEDGYVCYVRREGWIYLEKWKQEVKWNG